MLLTLKQHAYQMIREKLLTGAVKPGSRLSDDHLARELGISRCPVREALSQLANEGLVDHRPRFGAYVKQPDERELEELYEIREVLERYAARKAAAHISTDRLAELQKLCDEMRAQIQEYRAAGARVAPPELVQRFLRNDLAFHTIILEAAGNSRLTKLITDFKILIQIFGFVPVEHDLHVLRTTYRYHRRITQSIQERDAKAAGLWMAWHIRVAKRMVLEGCRKQAAGRTASGG